MVCVMVLVGGITRLTHSGLSMVKWEPIMGTLPPMSQEAWDHAFELYKDSPEYKVYNSHFSLDDFKKIFFWEYLHRLIARVIGIVFIVPFLIFWYRGYFNPATKRQMLVLFALGMLQGIAGWLMVASGLVDKPYVSHYRLAIHFMLALTLIAYLFWLAQEIKYKAQKSERMGMPRSLWLFSSVLVLQLIYGAFVAGLKAGLMYNTYPLMGDAYLPSELLQNTSVYGSTFLMDSGGMVQFLHRNLALALVLLFVYLVYDLSKRGLLIQHKPKVVLLGGILSLQFLLGVLTLLFAVPVSLGVLHQLCAMFLFIATIHLIFSLSFNIR